MPCLVFVGDVIGIFGGYMVSIHALGFAATPYINNTWNYLEWRDVWTGLVKAGVFGFIVALDGLLQRLPQQGRRAGRGCCDDQRGRLASILILLCNYMLTEFFFAI